MENRKTQELWDRYQDKRNTLIAKKCAACKVFDRLTDSETDEILDLMVSFYDSGYRYAVNDFYAINYPNTENSI